MVKTTGHESVAGQHHSTKNCCRERDSSLQKITTFKEAGDGLVTPSVSLHLASQGKPSPVTLREEGRDANKKRMSL